MWKPWDYVEGPAKALVIFVTALLVSSGLCGLQWLVFATAGRGAAPLLVVVFIFGYIELAVMAISAAGVVVMLIWLGVAKLLSLLSDRGPGAGPHGGEIQTLFPRDHEDS